MNLRTLWNSDLAEMLRLADSAQVWRYVFHALRESVGLSSLAVIEYAGEAMPKVLINFSDDDPVGNRISAYLKGAYLLDPFFHANLHEAIEGCYSIEDLAKRDFGEREYFDSFFSMYGLSDEINVFHQLADGAAIAISLGREVGAPKFNDSDHGTLRDCQPFLKNLARRLREGSAAQLSGVEQVLRTHFHDGVKSAIERLGSSVLTPREKTIFDFLIRGYPARATASRLNIKEGTVRMHRYNIYAKLDVSSQAELFGLVMETLKLIDLTDNRDPLVILTERTRVS